MERNKDYILDFDDSGRLAVTLLSTGAAYGAAEVTVTAKVLAPEMVTEDELDRQRMMWSMGRKPEWKFCVRCTQNMGWFLRSF
ncbi:MAG: hypothetical protein ACLSEY_09265 [Enterocloster sp.]